MIETVPVSIITSIRSASESLELGSIHRWEKGDRIFEKHPQVNIVRYLILSEMRLLSKYCSVLIVLKCTVKKSYNAYLFL